MNLTSRYSSKVDACWAPLRLRFDYIKLRNEKILDFVIIYLQKL